MATRNATEESVGRRSEMGLRRSGTRSETTRALLTTEFWAMVGIIAATLIAAAIADNFDAPRAWLIVGIVATGYIVSRGIAKAGTASRDDDRTRDL